jgi:elongation factor P--beta-lysine ligase
MKYLRISGLLAQIQVLDSRIKSSHGKSVFWRGFELMNGFVELFDAACDNILQFTITHTLVLQSRLHNL